MQYLFTMIMQVKHEVAGVRYVRGDHSYMLVIHVEMQPPVRVQGQSKTRSNTDLGLVQHWPLDTVVLQDRLV